jgi:VHL beta domain
MTMHLKFLRSAAKTAVAAVVATSILALAGSAASSQATPRQPQALAAKTGACHITKRQSTGGMPPTTIRFVNHASGTVGVYWLNFQGFLVYYEKLAPKASFKQSTFRSNAWVMLNSSFSCVGYVVTSGAPQYVIK